MLHPQAGHRRNAVVAAAQAQVGQHRVGPLAGGGGQGLIGIGRHADLATQAAQHRQHALAHRFLVVHHQQVQAGQQGRAVRRRRRSHRRRQLGLGQHQADLGAHARGRLQAQLQLQQVGQALDDGQPQAQALVAVALGVAQLVELFEHPLLLIVRDARAGVADGQAQRRAGQRPRQHRHSHLQLHLALVGVLQRVVHQVAQHALEQQGVGAHAGVQRAGQVQAQALAPGHRLKFSHQLRQKGVQRKRPGLHRHHAGIELGHVQQGVELAAQGLQRQVHLVGDLARALVQRRHHQRRAEQCQRVHGLAQVVAGRRQKTRLGAVGGLGQLQRVAQLLAGVKGFAVAQVGVARQHHQKAAVDAEQQQHHQRRAPVPAITRRGQHPHPVQHQRHQQRQHIGQEHRQITHHRRHRARAERQHIGGLQRALQVAQVGPEQDGRAMRDAAGQAHQRSAGHAVAQRHMAGGLQPAMHPLAQRQH